jgi:hypothetical protein
LIGQAGVEYYKAQEGDGKGGYRSPQRKGREFKVVDLAALRTAKGLSIRKLASMMVPPVGSYFISLLENGQARASPATLFDLSRIFGSIDLEDELGNRYTLVYKGRIPPPLEPDVWP